MTRREEENQKRPTCLQQGKSNTGRLRILNDDMALGVPGVLARERDQNLLWCILRHLNHVLQQKQTTQLNLDSTNKVYAKTWHLWWTDLTRILMVLKCAKRYRKCKSKCTQNIGFLAKTYMRYSKSNAWIKWSIVLLMLHAWQTCVRSKSKRRLFLSRSKVNGDIGASVHYRDITSRYNLHLSHRGHRCCYNGVTRSIEKKRHGEPGKGLVRRPLSDPGGIPTSANPTQSWFTKGVWVLNRLMADLYLTDKTNM